MIPLLIYVGIFIAAYLIVNKLVKTAGEQGFSARKTVTFGDESAVRPNRVASVVSIATILLLWGYVYRIKINTWFLACTWTF